VSDPPERCQELVHPTAGRLWFDVTTLQVLGDANLTLWVYTAELGSETADKLARLLDEPPSGWQAPAP
jgi:hypothetical protein